jgi:hypothetical protein
VNRNKSKIAVLCAPALSTIACSVVVRAPISDIFRQSEEFSLFAFSSTQIIRIPCEIKQTDQDFRAILLRCDGAFREAIS